MKVGMEAVKLIEAALALGFSVSESIQRVVDSPLSVYGEPRGFTKTAMSQCVTGAVPHQRIREALADDLQVPVGYIARLIDTQERSADVVEPEQEVAV